MYELQRNRGKSAIHVRITAKQSENCDTCTKFCEKQRKCANITTKCDTGTKYCEKQRKCANSATKCDTCTNYSETERKVRNMYEVQRNRAKSALHVRNIAKNSKNCE